MVRHDRYGLVSPAELPNGGADLATFSNAATDNDGLWTGMYAAAQVLRAGALAAADPAGPPTAAFNASLAEVQARWAALKFLFDVTGSPACPARSFAKTAAVLTGVGVGGVADETS